MKNEKSEFTNVQQPDYKKAIGRSVLFFFVSIPVLLALLFLPAGTFHWYKAWIFISITLADVIVRIILLYNYNPELLIERQTKHKGTKAYDRIFQVLYTISSFSIYVVAGLDTIRFKWSEPLPFVFIFIGLGLFIISSIIMSWTMVNNKFFERTVRIQEERGHQVCTTGPYAYIRHPGYVGFSILFTGTALILGSRWALVPVIITILFLILRTALEDKTLKNELTGYKDYSEKVRFRLIPGVW